jgi:ABC-type phosphate transport system substrate-binding protein
VKKRTVLKIGLVGLAASILPVIGAGQAFADYAPQPGDVVGVGGDTPQYAVDFALNGSPSDAFGFDQTATVNRVISFLATPDSNGRSAYAQGSTESSPVPLNPTDVLRAGDNPVQRVSSSGNALTALLADTGAEETINYISSASLPSSAQQSAAASAGWGYLHVVEIGTDSVQIAVDQASTNAPSGGLSAAELLGIYKGTYTTWNSLPDNSGGSSATIIPLLPPTSSSIYKTFLADLKTANDNVTPTLSNPNIATVEQNDPTAITGLGSNAANAIVPFSAGRLALWNTSYFHDPTVAFPGGAALSPGVALLSGTAPDGGTAYDSPLTDYIIFRQSDATSTTPLEPGGTHNWVQSLFSDPGGSAPFFDRSTGQTLLAEAGITPNYQDLGNVT